MTETFVQAEDVKVMLKEVIVSDPQFHFLEVLEAEHGILCLKSTGGSAKKLAYIRGLRGEIAMLSVYKYILCVNATIYNTLSEEDKKKVLFHQLLHITPEFDGKLNSHDIGDFKAMLDKYGIHYLPAAIERIA